MFPSTCIARRSLPYLTAVCLLAQAKPDPDVLIFVDGEKLIGHLISATDSTVVFKSDMAGPVTVGWAKIQDLRSQGKFAVIPKDLTLRNSEDAAKVPQGTLEMTNQKVELSSTPPQTIPVGSVSSVLPEKAFERAFHRQKLLEGWTGNARFGLSLTESTKSNEVLNYGFNLSRSDPSESWLRTRSRTNLDFNGAYGKFNDPVTGDSTIALFQANAVHDVFFKPRFFGFVGTTFEHNSPQGLELLQAYGGGVGVVIINNERTTFEARGGLGYMHQQFGDTSLNRNLVGSRFGQNFSHTFAHGIMFYEQGGIRPAWNYERAFFAGFNASLSVPLYRRMSVNISSFDSYLNNPPPYFKKNSFQLTIGAQYSFR